MKKKLLSLVAIMFCGFALFTLTACGSEKAKTFTTDFGYSITLTTAYSEKAKTLNFDYVLESKNVVVMVKEETFTELNALATVSDAANMTIEDYLNLVYNANKSQFVGFSTPPTLDSETNLWYFIYSNNGFDYYGFANKGAESFYLTQFAEKSADEVHPETYLKHALTITVE